ncbi:MAG TPA: DUF3093 domain-containing protein [Umezawaea sp.]|nr:DUF3093 domain-containing protein [Umezawaea sp.]
MSESAVTAPSAFKERLYVPWWGWLLPVTAAVLLIVRLGSLKVEVSGGELRVGDAHVPLELLGEVEVFTAKTKRKAMGPNLDPAAFVAHRGWIGPMVKVALEDPEDPTPYWLFSARRADRLAELLKK